MNKKHERSPHDKLVLVLATCLGLSALPITSAAGGTTPFEAFGLGLLLAAFASFGIAWHLAGTQDHRKVIVTEDL